MGGENISSKLVTVLLWVELQVLDIMKLSKNVILLGKKIEINMVIDFM
jgi:hypothetical protein